MSSTKIYTPSHPAIGVLLRAGVPVYYAMIDGRKHERSSACAMFSWIWKCERRGARIGS